MTQYTERVERARNKQAAEKWGKGVRYIHGNEGIIETKFNNGDIQYVENKPGGKTTWHREKLSKESLITNWQRALADLFKSE
jgi:hypothetical protein